jgi:hypothetical protein
MHLWLRRPTLGHEASRSAYACTPLPQFEAASCDRFIAVARRLPIGAPGDGRVMPLQLWARVLRWTAPPVAGLQSSADEHPLAIIDDWILAFESLCGLVAAMHVDTGRQLLRSPP